MKQLLAWTGSADSTITSEAVMAMAEKFNTEQEVCLQIPSARGDMQVKEGTSGSRVSLPNPHQHVRSPSNFRQNRHSAANWCSGPLNETANAVACGNGHNTSVETRDRRS